MRTAVTLVVAAASVLVGCSSGLPSERGPGTITDQSPVPPPPDRLVFQVQTAGGFVPATSFATGRPWLSVYGDGRAFVVVDRGTVAPGTPVELERASVPCAAVSGLLADAARTGLFTGGRRDLGDPGVTDTPTTSVTVRAGDGPARTVSAYALYYENEDRLTERQREARRALRNLIRAVDDSVTRDPTSSRWVPDRIDVTELDGYTRTADPQPWPGPALRTLLHDTDRGRCGVVSGAAARTVYETALRERTLHWREGTDVRPLAVRALLPGEKGC